MLFAYERPLRATSSHSITVHSAKLKTTSRSLAINQCSGGTFLRDQYRQLSAGSPKHSDTRWLLCWKKSFIFRQTEPEPVNVKPDRPLAHKRIISRDKGVDARRSF